MVRFCNAAAAAGLAARYEDEAEDLFETSSSISGDSEDEDRFSDGAGYEAVGDKLMQQPAASPVKEPAARGLNSDSLYDLSSMMAQLPVKKGLSNHYDGKSRSFACMSEVRCLEDLRKKEIPFNKIKPSRSYVTLDGRNPDCHVSGLNSRAIAKTPSGSSCANLMARNNTKSMLYRPLPIPVSKSGYHQ